MNSVGNLMLMAGSQNCSLGNKPFALKLKVYGSDNLLYQQKEIIEFVIDKDNPIWNKDCIKRRPFCSFVASRVITLKHNNEEL